MRRKITAFDIVVVIILLFCTLTCLIPLLNTIAISFSDKTSAALGQVYLWPKNFNVTSYREILKEPQFFRSFGNSVMIVLMGGFMNIFFSVVMAFPLSKGTDVFRLRNIYVWIIVFTMLFSGGLIPSFLLIKSLGLMDTYWALTLPSAVPVFSVIMVMNFYKGIPRALEEAAWVDGANPLYILFRIYIPLAMPVIATIALFAFVGHWNAFFGGKIYINTPAKVPLQTYIQSMTAQIDPSKLAAMTPEEQLRQQELSVLTFNAAKVIVSMVPIMLIYPFLQRYFVTGIVLGAVKE